MQWYYVQDSVQLGPVDDSGFEALVNTGVVSQETLVWREGMEEWLPYGEVQARGLGAMPQPGPVKAMAPAEAVCAECGNRFVVQDMVRYGDTWVCAGCKPVFFQRLKEGVALPGTVRYAGFWLRFVAKLIDGVIISAVNTVLAVVLGLAFKAPQESAFPFLFLSSLPVMAGGYAAGIAYVTYFVGKFGATPGKMACGIRIVMPDGGKVSYLRAFGRYFGEMLSKIILYVGYIMAGFDEEKRALHDRLCGTRVIYK